MHDPTEGGILGGITELAYASRKTIEFWADEMPIAEETRLAAGALGVDALKLISSGSLIATVPPINLNEAALRLQSLGELKNMRAF
jgi:hydrogenase expression/formation protein HypE